MALRVLGFSAFRGFRAFRVSGLGSRVRVQGCVEGIVFSRRAAEACLYRCCFPLSSHSTPYKAAKPPKPIPFRVYIGLNSCHRGQRRQSRAGQGHVDLAWNVPTVVLLLICLYGFCAVIIVRNDVPLILEVLGNNFFHCWLL